jgi:hypothetical protein
MVGLLVRDDPGMLRWYTTRLLPHKEAVGARAVALRGANLDGDDA